MLKYTLTLRIALVDKTPLQELLRHYERTFDFFTVPRVGDRVLVSEDLVVPVQDVFHTPKAVIVQLRDEVVSDDTATDAVIDRLVEQGFAETGRFGTGYPEKDPVYTQPTSDIETRASA
jgi:hypothetical protein